MGITASLLLLNGCNSGTGSTSPNNQNGTTSNVSLKAVPAGYAPKYIMNFDELSSASSLDFGVLDSISGDVTGSRHASLSTGYYPAGLSTNSGLVYLFSNSSSAAEHNNYEVCTISPSYTASCSLYTLPSGISYDNNNHYQIEFTANGDFVYLTTDAVGVVYKCNVNEAHGQLGTCAVAVKQNVPIQKIAVASFDDGKNVLYYTTGPEKANPETQFGIYSCNLSTTGTVTGTCKRGGNVSLRVGATAVAIDTTNGYAYLGVLDDNADGKIIRYQLNSDNSVGGSGSTISTNNNLVSGLFVDSFNDVLYQLEYNTAQNRGTLQKCNLVGGGIPNQCHNMLGTFYDGSIWVGYGSLN